MPALGGFLSANNPLLALADAVQSVARAPAEPKSGVFLCISLSPSPPPPPPPPSPSVAAFGRVSGLVHWLGLMASEAPAADTSNRERAPFESSGESNTATSWLSGIGWGPQDAEGDAERDTEEAERGKTGWLSGIGWGVQDAESEEPEREAEREAERELERELERERERIPRRPVPPAHHDPDDDIGGLEHHKPPPQLEHHKPPPQLEHHKPPQGPTQDPVQITAATLAVDPQSASSGGGLGGDDLVGGAGMRGSEQAPAGPAAGDAEGR